MSLWEEAMRAAGFGTDRAADRARREELSGARVGGEELSRFIAESQARQRRALTDAVNVDLRRRAERIREEARTMSPRVPAPEEHAPVAGHLLTYRAGRSGTEVTCECGRWDGWFNGARSRRRVLDDHADHCAAELRAAGPLRVQAVRVDRPELEP